MSLPGPHGPLILAFALIVSWLYLAAVLYHARDRTAPLAFAFLGPLFLLFKHSFVRELGHVGLIFLFVPLLWAVTLLFSEIGRADIRRLAPAIATLVVVLGVTAAPPGSPSRAALAIDRLPVEITAAIGSQPVAIFPYECAYAAANGLNFRPFPVLQSYSAYTPYLDAITTAFLRDPRTAPVYVLFDWQFIDGRNPLLDVPSTALALYRDYDLAISASGHLLLRRRDGPRFGPVG